MRYMMRDSRLSLSKVRTLAMLSADIRERLIARGGSHHLENALLELESFELV